MRSYLLIFAVALLGLNGCETMDERDVPGRIPRSEAIRIATAACHEFPRIYPDIPRARWEDRDGGYWVVDITEPSGTYGKFYMVSGTGRIVGVGKLPVRSDILPRTHAGEMPGGPIYDGQMVY